MKTRAIPALIGALATLSLSSCFYFPLGAIDNEDWTKTEPYPGVSESSSVVSEPLSSSEDSLNLSTEVSLTPTLNKLKFELATDRYIVSAANELIEGDVVIPESYQGLPVTLIKERGFSAASKMTSITIPGSVYRIQEYAFQYCSSLSKVTLGEGVAIICDYAFWWCESLSSIYFPDSLEQIEQFAFGECHSLTDVEIGPELDWIAKGAFAYCYSIEAFTVSEENRYLTSENGVLMNKDKTKVVSYPLDKGSFYVPENTVEIGAGSYCGATMTSIDIPDTVRTIGAYAFDGCEELETINFGNGLKLIEDSAFGYCVSLEEVVFPDSVIYIAWDIFDTCLALKRLVMPGVMTLSDYAIADCPLLESVSIGGNLTRIGEHMFGNCPSLKTLTYGGTTSDWESVEKAEDWNSWSSLETVVCANGQISLVA